MPSDDDFGGDEEIEEPATGGRVIPFPRLKADEGIAERWDRDRALTNTRLGCSYRFRAPLDALGDMIRKRGMPSLPLPASWGRLAARCTLYPGEIIAISGPSGGGKTSFAIQMVRAAVAAGTPALWLPLELDEPELNLRLVANITGTHTIQVRDWPEPQITRALELVTDRVHYIDRCRDPEDQIAAVRAAVQLAKRVYGRPPFVVVDYIGKMARGARDPRLMLADAIEGFRALTVEEECYTGLLSQTSRGNNAVLTGKVDLESAADAIGVSAETGELEHACSVNVALNVFKADDAETLAAHVLVSKARGTGREGREGYEFQKAGGVWRELDHLPPTPGEITREVKKRSKSKDPSVSAEPGTTRDDLNYRRAAEAAAARRLTVLDALKRAGAIGMGTRDLRRVRGSGDPARLAITLQELFNAGDAEKLENGRWRVRTRD